MNLIDLLSYHEGKTLEFKRDLSSPDNVLRAIVAFANTSGGTLLIGVEDRTQRVVGVRAVLAEEERMANLISDNIAPRLIPNIEVLPWRKTHVLAVEVQASPNRPHHLIKLGPEAGVMVRIGSTNRKADVSNIEEMRRFTPSATFDEQPIPDLYSEAIDFRVASEFFKPSRKLTPQSLQTLRITTTYQGRTVATNGGILLFGRDRLDYFPDAWVQVGRFTGTDRRRILDSTEVKTYLPAAVEDMTLPMVALREVIINAIVHAD